MKVNVGKKYSNEVRLSQMTFTERAIAMKELPQKLGIDRIQFWKIRNYTLADSSVADSD